jgi:hypothetical protein
MLALLAAHTCRHACGPTLCGENVRVSEPGNHQTSAAFAHRLRRMSGRDPHQPHRVATPLELLFDMTFVVAFGVAALEFAHMLVAAHIGAGLAGFSFVTFAVSVDQLQLVRLGV